MHIPDGYLGPQTYLAATAVMLPVWAVAAARVKATVGPRRLPLLALGAAFAFLIMLFNVPLMGGSSGHIVGAVLVAILLGPWAAVVAVSLALVVQAFVFGDGGITAIGANCLSMAALMPFVGWGVYRLVAGSAPANSPRRALAAALGGYLGLNASALLTAVLFGLQPYLAHTAAGQPLYCPYGLNVAVPAMMLPHLLIVGVLEGAVTGLVVAYVGRTMPEMLTPASSPSLLERFAWGVGALALLSPVALWLTARYADGTAWGEWSAAELWRLAGYLPPGLAADIGKYHAPLPDYALPGGAESPLRLLLLALGIVLCGVALWAGGRWLMRRGSDDPA